MFTSLRTDKLKTDRLELTFPPSTHGLARPDDDRVVFFLTQSTSDRLAASCQVLDSPGPRIFALGQRGRDNSVELECYPLFCFRRRLSRYSENAVTTGAELSTLVVKIRGRKYQRASSSDQSP